MSKDLESIEDSFYLFLGLNCSDCASDYYPQDEEGWDSNIKFGQIPDKLKEEYSSVALGKGWTGENYEKLLCPKCTKHS